MKFLVLIAPENVLPLSQKFTIGLSSVHLGYEVLTRVIVNKTVYCKVETMKIQTQHNTF
jgi:hypothetical protein